ncbi:MAG TPA: type VI secretion system baseplate subunit TssG [Chthoniobacterales bacterium]
MATPSRNPSDSLKQRLEEAPYKFDFFRAVRALEAQHADLPRVGFSERLEEDFVRFGQQPSLSFPTSTLESVATAPGHAAVQVFVNFLGLCGPNGPLPQHLTDYARDRQRNGHDPTLVRFLDIFHHRMLSFFYRAWAVNQKNVDFDRPEEARYATYFGSLFGIGSPALRERDAIPDVAKLFFTGRLSALGGNAEGLEAILNDFFGIPTRVSQFVGHWVPIPEANRCRLGISPATGSLGVNLVAGERKFEGQVKFRLRLGPMRLTDLKRLLPTGNSFQRLKAWVLSYVNQEFFWDVQCILRADEVPGLQLGGSAQLGWTTWLKGQPFRHNTEDPVFDPENH